MELWWAFKPYRIPKISDRHNFVQSWPFFLNTSSIFINFDSFGIYRLNLPRNRILRNSTESGPHMDYMIWSISAIAIWKWRSFIFGSDRFLITWWSSRKARSTFQSFQKRICLITNSRFPFSSRTDSKTTDCEPRF